MPQPSASPIRTPVSSSSANKNPVAQMLTRIEDCLRFGRGQDPRPRLRGRQRDMRRRCGALFVM